VSEETKQRTLPEFAQDLYKRGLAAANTGRYDEAIGLLNNIHNVLPVLTAAELQIGRCHWEMHRWQSARQHFEIAVNLEPNNADAAWTMGLLSLQMGDFKKGWQGY
jgi:tetratricopeptide (TPR) repeat protein